ncbi:TRAP transporter small permease subunit [Motilimonas eburnea]|uniref:TRAP transporter small permease subunit n=1 Tax=Motilimonas eburnea TaxID=1737488 RepID=UPI001E41466D|nr:TRAP transporter small permease subunit [Motilimonas eburnea]MCE2569933.1 TRAP transporter small permease subunit [Motilimonas eburnea]
MRKLALAISRSSDWLGNGLAWLLLLMVLVMLTVVLLRYGFDYGSIGLQESTLYLHALTFMLGAGYTLKFDDHVRVDVFYRNFAPRTKAWVDIFGFLFLLLPVCLFLFFSSWDYVIGSWLLLEGSPEPGGLPLVFILKTNLLLMPMLLLLQGIAQTLIHVLTLLGLPMEQPADEVLL